MHAINQVKEERSLEGPALHLLTLGITAAGDGWTLHVPVIHLEQREGSVKPGKGLITLNTKSSRLVFAKGEQKPSRARHF